MIIFDARNVRTHEARALFYVPLGEILFFAECAKAVADNHSGIISLRVYAKQGQPGDRIRAVPIKRTIDSDNPTEIDLALALAVVAPILTISGYFQ